MDAPPGSFPARLLHALANSDLLVHSIARSSYCGNEFIVYRGREAALDFARERGLTHTPSWKNFFYVSPVPTA